MDIQQLIEQFTMGQSSQKDFKNAMRTLSNYVLVEQYLIRKDNKVQQQDEKEPRDFDIFGNPRPKKNEDVIKYRYNEQDFIMIREFLKKIKFNGKPIIGIGKRVMIVFDDGQTNPLYSSNQTHEIDADFNKGMRDWADMIYILDKIKDLIMHVNENGITNFTDKNNDSKTICFKQTTGDFSIDCEINIEDMQEFCTAIMNKYSYQIEYEDFYTYSYLSLLMTDVKKRFPILSYTNGIEWNYYHKDYIEILEKIIGIKPKYSHPTPEEGKEMMDEESIFGIMGLLCDNDYYENRDIEEFNIIYGKELAILKKILHNISRHNKKLLEYFRNSRSHAHMNISTSEEMIQMDNKLLNSPQDAYSINSTPNFTITGFEEDLKYLLESTRSNITLDDLNREINGKNPDIREELSQCIDQIYIILLNAKNFANLTEKDIEDPVLLERYQIVGKYAEGLCQQNIHEKIKEKIILRAIQKGYVFQQKNK